MRKLLLVTAAGAGLLVASPASAQIYFGADPWGAGVQVGPFAFGVGPDYRWRRNDWYYGYAEVPRPYYREYRYRAYPYRYGGYGWYGYGRDYQRQYN